MECKDLVSRLLEEKGSDVFSVSPETSVKETAQIMAQHRIGAILILQREEVEGIFSERDLLTRVVLKGLDPAATPVKDVMSTDMVYVTRETPVCEAMAVMTERRCRHLPVLDDGKLQGMISIGDCTRWMSRNQDYTIHHLTHYIQNKYPG